MDSVPPIEEVKGTLMLILKQSTHEDIQMWKFLQRMTLLAVSSCLGLDI